MRIVLTLMFSCLWILAEAKHPQHLQPSHKYKITIYTESQTLNELEMAKHFSRCLPFINTPSVKIYHDYLEVETLDEWPDLDDELLQELIKREGHCTPPNIDTNNGG